MNGASAARVKCNQAILAGPPGCSPFVIMGIWSSEQPDTHDHEPAAGI
jgi:hypothetical protein